VIVHALAQRLPDAGQRATVLDEVPVDDRVVHPGEAVLGEPGAELARQVQVRRVGRIGHAGKRRDDLRAPADQFQFGVERVEVARDEQRAGDVDPGPVGRVPGEVQALDGEPAQGVAGEVELQLLARLDLVGAVVMPMHGSPFHRRWPATEVTGHRVTGSWGGSGPPL
jgi:hypothetical protein